MPDEKSPKDIKLISAAFTKLGAAPDLERQDNGNVTSSADITGDSMILRVVDLPLDGTPGKIIRTIYLKEDFENALEKLAPHERGTARLYDFITEHVEWNWCRRKLKCPWVTTYRCIHPLQNHLLKRYGTFPGIQDTCGIVSGLGESIEFAMGSEARSIISQWSKNTGKSNTTGWISSSTSLINRSMANIGLFHLAKHSYLKCHSSREDDQILG
jgi:hypothetical protein